MAEWLRRWTRNPLGSSRAGSNPADNVSFYTHAARLRTRSLPPYQNSFRHQRNTTTWPPAKSPTTHTHISHALSYQTKYILQLTHTSASLLQFQWILYTVYSHFIFYLTHQCSQTKQFRFFVALNRPPAVPCLNTTSARISILTSIKQCSGWGSNSQPPHSSHILSISTAR